MALHPKASSSGGTPGSDSSPCTCAVVVAFFFEKSMISGALMPAIFDLIRATDGC